MTEPKNPFNFGTGSIDKDQWLRDIDNEQDAFISRYSEAVNKHRATLLRDAFTDLRRRIANGDMLNRTADGQYQFGSALNREDKHMEEAYRRALGFMGDLARKQIQAPPPEPEKKAIGNLEERYIKSLNPAGKFNTEAYWKNQTDKERRNSLRQFLNNELSQVKSYQDFGNFGDEKTYTDRLNNVIKLLDSENANDWTLQQLGFTKNWLQQPTDQQETETPKSELDQQEEEIAQQVNDFTRRQSIENQRKQLAYTQDANFSQNFPSFKLPEYSFEQDLSNHTPAWGSIGQTREQYYNQSVSDLSNYFSKLATDWRSIISQQGTVQNDFLYNLSKLFSKTKDGQYSYQSVIDKLFSPTNDGRFLLKDTNEENDRRVFYNPSKNRFEVRGYNFLQVPSQKNGGILKFDGGGGFNFSEWDKQNNPQYYRDQRASNNTKKTEETYKQENSPREMTAADIAAISADILSIGASAVPGYGTAASAVLGVGSTLSNFISDINDSNTSLEDALWNGAKGLGADAIGLVPGFGAGAKGWKVATRLAKYGTSILAGLNTLDLAQNSPEIMNSFKKVLSLKVNDMNLQDWRNIQNGLSMLATAGRLGHGIAVHKGYKGQLKSNNQQTQNVKPEPKTKLDKAKAKLANYRDKFKGTGETYDYGGPNTLPWFHDANIYLWGANRSGFNLGLKNPYKVNMSTKLQQSPKSERATNSKSKEEKFKNTLPSDRGLVQNEQTHSYIRTKEIGGILKALRNGGIIKAVKGVKLSSNAGSWYNDVFSGYGDTIISKLKSLQGDDRQKAVDWLNGMQDQHSQMYTRAGNNFNATASGDVITHAYQVAYNHGNGFTTEPGGFNTLGIKPNYNSRYDFEGVERNTGDNAGQNWGPDGYYSQITDDRRILGRLDDWKDTEKLNAFNEKLKELGYTMDNNYDDKYYRIKPLKETSSPTNPNDAILQDMASKSGSKDGAKEIKDSLGGDKTIFNTNFENPIDPTPFIVAGKTMTGLMGNKNVYGNLIDEIPQAPLRDPINRQLAIVGWQERIKSGQNQLADLRRIQQMQQGSDQQTNFATALETDRTGRDIMDKAFQEDSGRQFETAQKLWNLKNEDIMYNTGVSDANRRAIADRARMIAQIRAAWRSGNNNILMGALSDTGNWLLKKYQREQDIINLAREQQLGTREQFLENEMRRLHPDYDSLKAKLSDDKVSNAEKDQIRKDIQKWNLEILRTAPSTWSQKIYNTFHTPGFGGGYKETVVPLSKDGSKLEIAKLKARSKDNDRYVSMIKDLRTTRSRRRRR